MSGLASRSLDEMLLAAAESGLSSEGREEQWEARRAEDDQVLETLRSAVLQHEPPEGGPPVASVDWARWSTADNRDSMHRQPLTTPREQPTWTAVFEDRPATVPGPLRGLEVGVKDLMHVDGHRVTAATRAHRSTPAAEAPAVSALRRAGADIVGTTNLHALAYGATGTSSDWGVPQNPAVPGAIPGGSSSGSAVAVAEGSAHVTVGTDTAGSIRIPAALCGVVGLKPTFGAVPVEGCHPLAPTLDHIGPLAGSVALVAEAFAAMAGQSPRESAPEDDAGQPVLGVLRGYFDTLLDPAVRAALAATLDRLQAAGFTLVDVDLPLAEHVPGAQLATMSMEALRSNLETLRERAYLLPPDVRLRLEAGLGRTPAQYEAAQQLRAA
ncbi:MAG: amidase, partial [Ornithinimicrobium sp.]|uniref:amidase n=1 Tax=Ornithinimicrobium sp. TaxID=1977084 RepID=UPI003D9ABD4E